MEKAIYMIAIACFLISGIKIVTYYTQSAIANKQYRALRNIATPPKRQQEKEQEQEEVPFHEPAEFLKINDEFKGWLLVDDTAIDYPIVQAENNTYYLKHDFYKDMNHVGALFIDYRIDQMAENIIIYGHNLNNGEMFSELTAYKDEAFARLHRKINLQWNEEERVYRIDYICVIEDSGEEADHINNLMATQSSEIRNTFLASIQEKSLIRFVDEENNGNELLILCTCDKNSNQRLLIVAERRI